MNGVKLHFYKFTTHDCSKTVQIYETYTFISIKTILILLWKLFKQNTLILLAWTLTFMLKSDQFFMLQCSYSCSSAKFSP